MCIRDSSPCDEFFLARIDEYDAGVESNTASKSEHKNDKNNAKKKYAKSSVIYRRSALLYDQEHKNELLQKFQNQLCGMGLVKLVDCWQLVL